MSMNNSLKQSIGKNPVLVLFLGACPAMGASAQLKPALAMAVAMLLVMVVSAALMSLLKKAVPEQAQLPAAVIIISAVVSIVQLLMSAFLPQIEKMLGIYLAVAAVNLLLVGNGREAAEQSFAKAVSAALVTGIVFGLTMLGVAAVREIFGAGSIAGFALPALSQYNVPLLSDPAGGFVVFAIAAAVVNRLCPGAELKAQGPVADAAFIGTEKKIAQGE